MSRPDPNRASFSLNHQQLVSLDQLLTTVARGGDASVIARRQDVQSALQLIRSARRRAEGRLRLVHSSDTTVEQPALGCESEIVTRHRA